EDPGASARQGPVRTAAALLPLQTQFLSRVQVGEPRPVVSAVRGEALGALQPLQALLGGIEGRAVPAVQAVAALPHRVCGPGGQLPLPPGDVGRSLPVDATDLVAGPADAVHMLARALAAADARDTGVAALLGSDRHLVDREHAPLIGVVARVYNAGAFQLGQVAVDGLSVEDAYERGDLWQAGPVAGGYENDVQEAAGGAEGRIQQGVAVHRGHGEWASATNRHVRQPPVAGLIQHGDARLGWCCQVCGDVRS